MVTNGMDMVFGDLFVSERLLAAAPGVRRGLLACFAEGAVSSWENGLHLSSWGTLNDKGVTVPEGAEVPRRVAKLPSRALAAFNGDHWRDTFRPHRREARPCAGAG